MLSVNSSGTETKIFRGNLAYLSGIYVMSV